LEFTADQWREEGPWLLLLLLPLAALAFRRGYLAVALIVVLPPPPAQAMEWQELWLRQNQRAAQAMDQGRHQQAAELFTDPQWQASAHYRAGEYDKAIEKLEGIETTDALYNKGNALAKSQRLEEALQAYDQALELDPSNGDAKHNRKLVEQQLKQQQQSQQQSGEDQEHNEDPGDQQQSDGENQKQADNQSEAQPQQGEGQPEQNSASQKPEQESPAKDDEQTEAEAEETEMDKQAQDDTTDSPEPAGEETASAELSNELQPTDPATEQWLRRIPDDPGGLLRRKFLYQYRKMEKRQPEQQPW
jgi:Ca-activated chloride channel family protein